MGDPSINGENDTGAKYSSFNGGNDKRGKLVNIFCFSGFHNYVYLKCTCFDIQIWWNYLHRRESSNVGSVFLRINIEQEGGPTVAQKVMGGHTAPEWCQPVRFATLSFSAFLVVCDQDKSVQTGQQILKGGNFCLPTSLLLRDYISLGILKCFIESCPSRI